MAFPVFAAKNWIRWKSLEIEPDSKLILPRIITLRTGHAPVAHPSRQVEASVIEHGVVEKVRDDELEVKANTLPDLHFLRHTHIHVPIPEASDLSDAASTLVQAQDRI